EIAEENKYAAVHAFEDPVVMAGQVTIGCEILQDLADVDTVIVPIGGGVAIEKNDLCPECLCVFNFNFGRGERKNQ
ncbi:pyridoxal-phosphate dependent enzyme, partial [Rhizobium ruizarguesonis]